jgi:hypothetical protein
MIRMATKHLMTYDYRIETSPVPCPAQRCGRYVGGHGSASAFGDHPVVLLKVP